jgi:hypothetical protein
MDITAFLLASFLKGIIAIVLLAAGYYTFDWITGFSFKKVLKNEKITGGDIFVCCLIITLGLVLALGVL